MMDQIRITALPVGALGTNCYILHREGSQEAVVVDPGMRETGSSRR